MTANWSVLIYLNISTTAKSHLYAVNIGILFRTGSRYIRVQLMLDKILAEWSGMDMQPIRLLGSVFLLLSFLNLLIKIDLRYA